MKRQSYPPTLVQQLEARVLMSFSGTITAAPNTPGTSAYDVYLNTVGDQASEWDVNWGDGNTTPYYASSQSGGVFPANFAASHTYGSSGSYNITAIAHSPSGNITTSLGLSSTFGASISGSSPAQYNGQTTYGGTDDDEHGGAPVVADLNTNSANYGDVYVANQLFSSPFSQQIQIVRYTSNGQLDTSWGSSGTYTIPSFGPGSTGDYPFALAVSPDSGSLAVVGGTIGGNWDVALLSTASGGSVTWQDYGSNAGAAHAVVFDSDGTTLDVAGEDSSQMTIAKYDLSGGGLHSAFGSSGLKRIANPSGVSEGKSYSLIETTNTNLIVGGEMDYTVTGMTSCGFGFYGVSDFALAEVTSSGSTDTSFGSSGLKRTNIGVMDNSGATSSDSLFQLMDVEASGTENVIAAGRTNAATFGAPHIGLAEYDVNSGGLNTGFGSLSNGTEVGPEVVPAAATLAPRLAGAEGDFVVVGQDFFNGYFTAYGFDQFGATKTSFGYGGELITDFGSPSGSSGSIPQSITFASDNTLIATVTTGSSDVGLLSMLPSNRVSVGNGSVTGTAFYDSNADGYLQSTESVAPNVTVAAVDGSNNIVGTAVSNSSGVYTIADLPTSGTFAIVPISRLGYSTPILSTTSSLGSGGSETIDVPFQRMLPAPFDLTAAYNGSTEIDLSWTSMSGGFESGFHIEESVNGGAFTAVASTASGVTSKAITGLSSTSDYMFRVAAYDAFGDSNYSNYADPAAPPTPASVTLMMIYDPSNATSAVLSWDGSGSPSGSTYSIYRGNGTDTPTTLIASGVTATTYTDTAVTAGQTYNYVVITVGTLPPTWVYAPASPPSDPLGGTVPTSTLEVGYAGAVLLMNRHAAANSAEDATTFGITDEHVYIPLATPTGSGSWHLNSAATVFGYLADVVMYGDGALVQGGFPNSQSVSVSPGDYPRAKSLHYQYNPGLCTGIGGNKYVDVCGCLLVCSTLTSQVIGFGNLAGEIVVTYDWTNP